MEMKNANKEWNRFYRIILFLSMSTYAVSLTMLYNFKLIVGTSLYQNHISLQLYIRMDFLIAKLKKVMAYIFWTPGLPEGVLSNRPCPSVRPSVCVSVLKYLRDRSLVFSHFLHEVMAPQGYKSDRA